MLGSATVYLGLFLAAFVAATILPAQSEAVLAGLLANGQHPAAALIGVATVGNTLGAVVNWWLGRSLEKFRDRRWFPVSMVQLERTQVWFQRWGLWSLLLSWMPFGGDALTVAAGLMRVPLLPFTLIVGVAKLTRYLVVAGVVGMFLH